MKQFLLSIYQPDGAPPPPEILQPIMQRVDALREEMRKAGAWIFAGGLEPPHQAKVVRTVAGASHTTDGPFIESKEHIGGFWIIQAPDLETALDWGRKAALATTLPIEVRAFQEPG